MGRRVNGREMRNAFGQGEDLERLAAGAEFLPYGRAARARARRQTLAVQPQHAEVVRMKPRHAVEIVEMHHAARGRRDRAGNGFSALERNRDEKIEIVARPGLAAGVRADDADRADAMTLRERGDELGEIRQARRIHARCG